MLGVQLYDLISKAGLDQQQVVAYYGFMTQLGMAAQAIDIVYQLNASEESRQIGLSTGPVPAGIADLRRNGVADVNLKGLAGDERLVAFRYHDLILLKNQSSKGIVVRGRPLGPGAFCRIYSGQRIVLGEQVLTYQDLAYYFNAKKNVSLTQIYLSIDSDDEVQLEKVRTRESVLEVRFGLKVQVRALRDVDALAQRRGPPGRHPGGSDAGRQNHLSQRLRAAAQRSAPARPRPRRALSAQGLQVRATSSPTIHRSSTSTTFCFRPAPAAKCC